MDSFGFASLRTLGLSEDDFRWLGSQGVGVSLECNCRAKRRKRMSLK